MSALGRFRLWNETRKVNRHIRKRHTETYQTWEYKGPSRQVPEPRYAGSPRTYTEANTDRALFW
jgi:hypothetical protein